MVVPICLDSQRPVQPSAILRVGHIFSDYQRRGFFRIGVLPLLVIDGPVVEIRDPMKLSEVLSTVHCEIFFKDHLTKSAEARDFSVRFGSEGGFLLQARLVRLERSGQWRLHEGMVKRPGAPAIAFQKASLQITGREVGELRCETTNGVAHFNLLSSLSTLITNQVPYEIHPVSMPYHRGEHESARGPRR
jgi:hypothetical protein